MREILFRAWIHPDCGGDVPQELFATMDYSENNYDLSEFFGLYDPVYFSIMQYTGLTDKNGVKIFEGDILSIPSGMSTPVLIEYEGEQLTAYKPNENNKGAVIFTNGSFCVQKLSRSNSDSDNPYYGQLGSSSNIKYGFQLEVIGNIHANPELLVQ